MNTHRRIQAFSLIEILVVIVIIAIVVSVVLLSIGVLGDNRDLETEAQRLTSRLLIERDLHFTYHDYHEEWFGLYLGDGYIIHGTIFQTLLGRPVTHGCVRLGDEDLKYVYGAIPVGARVYIF